MRSSYLGFPTLVALVIANMIGAGVFTTSGFALGDLGSPLRVLAAWVIGGGIAYCGAVSYGLLARLMPESGGEYLFLSRAVHPLAGFVAGWISLWAGFTGAIAYSAITFVAYAAPSWSGTVAGSTLATLTVLAAALMHGITVKYGVRIQNAVVLVKLLLMAGFCGYAFAGTDVLSWHGLTDLGSEAASVPEFSVSAFALTLMWVSFSYSGFNAAIYVAGEVPGAQSMVPRAMAVGTLITAVAYVLVNAIFVLAPPLDAIAFKEDIAAITARILGGEPLALLVRIVIAMALFTSVSAMIMAGPRVYAKMADDGLLPAQLRFTHATPAVAIVVQALLVVIVVWIAELRELLSYLGFTLGLSAALTVASLFLVARRVAGLRGYPWAPLIFVLFTLLFAALAANRNPREMLAALVTIGSGAGLYLSLARRRISSPARR
jgi:APA family basic amino acid/polyamine antiporter